LQLGDCAGEHCYHELVGCLREDSALSGWSQIGCQKSFLVSRKLKSLLFVGSLMEARLFCYISRAVDNDDVVSSLRGKVYDLRITRLDQLRALVEAPDGQCT
jgi:hypothetical protein